MFYKRQRNLNKVTKNNKTIEINYYSIIICNIIITDQHLSLLMDCLLVWACNNSVHCVVNEYKNNVYITKNVLFFFRFALYFWSWFNILSGVYHVNTILIIIIILLSTYLSSVSSLLFIILLSIYAGYIVKWKKKILFSFNWYYNFYQFKVKTI